jgi:hypothetical protein
MAMRTRLSLAASSLASDLFGRPWRILDAKMIAQGVQGGLVDQDERERWSEFYAELQGEVLLRLRSGEWRAWGWRQGDTTPAEIPIELFERDDVAIDSERGAISCAVCAFDNVTLDMSMTGIPSVTPAKTIKAAGVIGPAFKKWTDTLPERPTRRQAIQFAKDGNFLQAEVLRLYDAGPKRERGRPAKTDND